MKTGTSCNRCKHASDLPSYDPQIAYGFCQRFEVNKVDKTGRSVVKLKKNIGDKE